MTGTLTADYYNTVLKPRHTSGKGLVVLCDGHSSHLSFQFAKAIKDDKGALLIRPPHTTNQAQPEDLKNFGIFKKELRKAKQNRLQWLLQQGMRQCLGWEDMVVTVRDPWMKAFNSKHSAEAWELAGVKPYTRKPYWQAKCAEEERERTAARAEGLPPGPTRDFASVHKVMFPCKNAWQTEEQVLAKAEARLKSGKLPTSFPSSLVWSHGSLTVGAGFQVLEQLQKNRKANEEEEVAKQARISAKRDKRQARMLKDAAHARDKLLKAPQPVTGEVLATLTNDGLKALLHAHGDKTSGNKKDMLERLTKSFKMATLRGWIIANEGLVEEPVAEPPLAPAQPEIVLATAMDIDTPAMDADIAENVAEDPSQDEMELDGAVTEPEDEAQDTTAMEEDVQPEVHVHVPTPVLLRSQESGPTARMVREALNLNGPRRRTPRVLFT